MTNRPTSPSPEPPPGPSGISTSSTSAVAQTGVQPVSHLDTEPSIGRLVAGASRDISSLIRNEISLAKAEVKVSVKNGGMAAGLLGAAAFLLVLALVMLSFAIAYFIHFTGLALAWCFLIVWLFYTLVAGVLVILGIRRVRKVRPPERAIEQAKETRSLLKRG